MNQFLKDYNIHDVLQNYLESNLELMGLDIRQHGTDDRHSGTIWKGYGPDITVYKDGELICYIEIKSKRLTSDDWYGRLDRHHWEEYLYGDDDNFFDGAKNVDVPVFLYFGVVDEETDTVVRDGFISVDDEDQVVEGFKCRGDIIVELDTVQSRNFNWLYRQLFDQQR